MNSKSIMSKITEALLQIEKSEGVKIDFGFSDTYTGLQFRGVVKDNQSKQLEESLNLSVCRRIGFTQNIVGVVFTSSASGGNFRITSIQQKNRKYPVIAENLENGKSYKFSVASVKKALGGDQNINRKFNLDKLIEDTDGK